MSVLEQDVDTLRRQYGRIAKIVIKGSGEEVFFRGLRFEEYIKVIDKARKVSSSEGAAIYDFEPEILPYIITTCVIYPKDYNTDLLMNNPGLLYNIASYIMQVTLFEDDAKLEKYYVDRYKVFSTVLGSIRMKLVEYFGLDGYIKTKDMTQEEIVDLLAMGELLHREPGNFSTLLNKPHLFPRDRRGRVDLKRFLGEMGDTTLVGQPETPQSERSAEIAENMQVDREREAVLTRRSHKSKNISFDEMQNEAMMIGKQRLAEQIAMDKARYGDAAIKKRAQGQMRFLGNINDLDDIDPALKQVLKK